MLKNKKEDVSLFSGYSSKSLYFYGAGSGGAASSVDSSVPPVAVPPAPPVASPPAPPVAVPTALPPSAKLPSLPLPSDSKSPVLASPPLCLISASPPLPPITSPTVLASADS